MASTYEYETRQLLRKILDEGVWVDNKRTGRKCLTIPEHTMYYDVANEPPPLLTTKQSYPVTAWAEFLGYLRRYQWANQFDKIGTKTYYSNANETEAWLNNPYRAGTNHLGEIYGAALESWELPQLFKKLMAHEDDRGLKINFWKPEKFLRGCIRACMYEHTFTILGDTIHMESSQRSVDMGLGHNFNSLQCYFLLKFVSHITGLKAGKVKHNMVNLHIYDSHIDTIVEMLSRVPYDLDVTFKIADWVKSFDDLVANDEHAREYFTIKGYKHQGKLEMDLVP